MTQLFDLQSLNYYEQNSELFVDNTLEVDRVAFTPNSLGHCPAADDFLISDAAQAEMQKTFRNLGIMSLP